MKPFRAETASLDTINWNHWTRNVINVGQVFPLKLSQNENYRVNMEYAMAKGIMHYLCDMPVIIRMLRTKTRSVENCKFKLQKCNHFIELILLHIQYTDVVGYVIRCLVDWSFESM